jgi:hypothetical protein
MMHTTSGSLTMKLFTFATVLLAAAGTSSLFAQSTAARLSGVITDSSRGLVPGTSVEAVDTATGRKITVSSNADGRYVLYPLPPGVYDVSFEKSGFQQARVTRLQLYANDDVLRNVQLSVGSIAQEVTVSAAAAMVSHSISSESTVTEDQV